MKDKIKELVIMCGDLLILKFMDTNSDAMLEEKVEVLEKRIAGVPIADIPNYYKVLELYPENEMWD